MAIVKFIASGCPMNNIFPYVMNGNKTEDGILVSGIHCTPESALDEFRFVKNKFGKTDGRQYYHIVQSFSPDDKLTSETAHEIGLRFAEYFPGYQIVVATHCDRDHLHNHLVMNSVNMENSTNFSKNNYQFIVSNSSNHRIECDAARQHIKAIEKQADAPP